MVLMTTPRTTTSRDAATGFLVATDETGFSWFLTECCGASAKGSANSLTGVVCRSCYHDVDPALGGIPGDPPGTPTVYHFTPPEGTDTMPADRMPARAELVDFDKTLTLEEITVGLLVEMADLSWETPATRRKWGGVWKVEEISARAGRFPVHLVNPMGTKAAVSPSQIKLTALTWAEVETADVTLGTVVAWKVPPRACDPTDRFVVIKLNGDTVNLARLGGDGDRFYRSVPRSKLTVVHGETITLP